MIPRMTNPIPRRFRPPSGSYFLFGPRGTGKTTLLRALHPDAVFVDLLDPAAARELSARPERLSDIARGAPAGVPIVVDEVQRVPALLTVVHALIESDGRCFILTGSSARKLRRAGEDLLAGRAVLRTLHPFTAAELGDQFDIERALHYGTIPLVWSADDPDDVLRSYAALYVREEVQQEGLVRNAGSFSRFLEAVSFSHASLLNASAVSRECAVERKTVAAYIDILHDLLLAFSLRVFTKRASRALVGHPKLYLVDPGLFRSLRPSGPLDRPEEIGGAALEGFVISMLRADIAYRNADEELSFWRTRSGVEVDCIAYGPGRFDAIEVKNTDRVRPEDERGLRAFLTEYPEARATVVYRGELRLERSGIRWVPVESFLRSLGT